MGVEGAFVVVACAEDDAGGGAAVGGGGTVYGVDVVDEGFVVGEGGEEDAAFEVPGERGGGYARVYVPADEGADAVDFPTKAGGVVFVAGEAEMGVVEVVGRGCFIIAVEGGVDGAADGGLSFCVCKGDFDFLEGEDVRPFPAAEAGSEGGLGGGWL